MRRRPQLPDGLVDTRRAAEIAGISVASMYVYRSNGYEHFGPPFHHFDGHPCYLIAELREWAAARAAKARAKAEALERAALSAEDEAALAEINR